MGPGEVKDNTEESRPAAGNAVTTVDVIIPAYRGLEETRLCLESVLANPQETVFEAVVINDASPEPGLVRYLEELESAGRITLLRNEFNIGYVDSANLGMMLHPDRDVVLLNSDTEVFGDWLDRLRRCALERKDAATVTPFSNNATICSYPRYLEENPVPGQWPPGLLDEIFRSVNSGRFLEIPTAIGFCMYITRDALNRVGYFDSMHFGRGYGEENDFSMRARFEGLRHYLCADVFVYHQGGASFGRDARAASDAAQETLRLRHPQYEPLIHAHFAADPERELRRRADIARLAGSPRRKIMMVTHRLGGGTEKFVMDLAALLEPDFEVLVLRPVDTDRVGVEWARSGEEFSAYFRVPEEYGELTGFLRGIGLDRVHFHHTVEIRNEILVLPADMGIPYDFSAHDYYVICPLYNLLGKSGTYCGEPGAQGCRICLGDHEALASLEIGEWRSRWEALLNGADRVIVPSMDALERLRRYFPHARYLCLPHPEAGEGASPVPAASRCEVKVLVLGELSVAKGVRLLEQCAVDAKERALPLCFRVIGWARERVRQEPDLPLFFLGPYDDSQLARLIERERADVIFFPALWPETYSYTLSAAIRSGLPIAAPRLGAFPERLEGYPDARLLDPGAGPGEWNETILSLANDRMAAVDNES